MNQDQTKSSANPIAMLRAMVGIGVLCGLLIVLTYEGTLPRVERLRAEALERAIFKVLPGIESTQAFTWDGEAFVPASEESAEVVYAGYDSSGKFTGMAIEAAGQGYADIIRILYGYDVNNQTVIGFYVLESKETPGLGDKIEKDAAFLENFEALDVSLSADFSRVMNQIIPVKKGTKQNPWEVDGITGATISSRAIGDILGESTAVWAPRIYQNRDQFSDNTSGHE